MRIDVLRGPDGWRVTSTGDVFATREEAVSSARAQLVANGGGELVVHFDGREAGDVPPPVTELRVVRERSG